MQGEGLAVMPIPVLCPNGEIFILRNQSGWRVKIADGVKNGVKKTIQHKITIQIWTILH